MCDTRTPGKAPLNAAEATFRLKKPCGNCPFRKKGGIELAPGRLDGIIEDLLSSDYSTFQCHKTVHNDRTGGDWDDEGVYHASGQESMCAGAIIYLEKVRQPSVGMRVGRVIGVYDPQKLLPYYDQVMDPVTTTR